jgi:NitT/TauT family transport system permease protein
MTDANTIVASNDPRSPGIEPPHDKRTAKVRSKGSWPRYRLLIQVALAVAFVLAWQYLPTIDALSERFKFLNKLFISAPSDVYTVLKELLTHGVGGVTLWPYLRTTLWATILGVAIGMVLGAAAGLVTSNFRRLSEVVRPFIILANTVPRIALIPIFVVIAGPTPTASILSVITVVFFLVFFNAFEGGTTLPRAMVDNARLLGASPFEVMRTIRLPRVLSWTFAAVPNAISFGLVVAVTTEVIAGVQGIGQLFQQSMVNLNTGLTFALIVVLVVVGLVLYGLASLLRDVLLRWDVKDDG